MMNEMDVVGDAIVVTLVNGVSLDGVIFTYCEKEGLLVLMQNSEHEQPSLRVIRTAFITQVASKTNLSPSQHLPDQLDGFNYLPSMQVGHGKSVLKTTSTKLREACEKRQALLGPVTNDIPIAAVDALTKLARIYPDVSWNKEEKVINASENVVIVGNPTWETPQAVPVDGADEMCVKVCERYNNVLKK